MLFAMLQAKVRVNTSNARDKFVYEYKNETPVHEHFKNNFYQLYYYETVYLHQTQQRNAVNNEF